MALTGRERLNHARYPDGFPEGAPLDYFDENMAKEAINAVERILKEK